MSFMGSGIGAALGNSATGFHQGRMQRQTRENAEFEAQRAADIARQADEMYEYARRRREAADRLHEINDPTREEDARSHGRIQGIKRPHAEGTARYEVGKEQWEQGVEKSTRPDRAQITKDTVKTKGIDTSLGVDQAEDRAGYWRSEGAAGQRQDERTTGQVVSKGKRKAAEEAANVWDEQIPHREKVRKWEQAEKEMVIKFGEAYHGWAEMAEKASLAAGEARKAGNMDAITEFYGEIRDGYEAEFVKNEDGSLTLQFKDEETGELAENIPSKTYSSPKAAADHFEQVMTDPTYFEAQGGAVQQGLDPSMAALAGDSDWAKTQLLATLKQGLPENAGVDPNRILIEVMQKVEGIDKTGDSREQILDAANDLLAQDQYGMSVIDPSEMFPDDTPEVAFEKAFKKAMQLVMIAYDQTGDYTYSPYSRGQGISPPQSGMQDSGGYVDPLVLEELRKQKGAGAGVQAAGVGR